VADARLVVRAVADAQQLHLRALQDKNSGQIVALDTTDHGSAYEA
jgi:hypothetical protein